MAALARVVWPKPVAAQGKAGGTLTFATSALPPNLEPHMQGLDIWQRRKPLIYENLVWIDHALEPKPELCERWEQKSPTEYVFHLRRGVRFHNGKELAAEDVKYTYDRCGDPKVSPGANDLTYVKQIDVVDRSTVRFLLSNPVATFLVNIAGKYNGVIPRDSAGDGKAPLTKAIGTGPFALEEFDPSRRLVLKKNGAYWGTLKPLLDAIVFQAIPDESSIVAGLRTGQVTLAEFSSALSFQVARSVGSLVAVQAPSTRWEVLDLAGDQEPTSKLEVRQAIALALETIAGINGGRGGLRPGAVAGGTAELDVSCHTQTLAPHADPPLEPRAQLRVCLRRRARTIRNRPAMLRRALGPLRRGQHEVVEYLGHPVNSFTPAGDDATSEQDVDHPKGHQLGR